MSDTTAKGNAKAMAAGKEALKPHLHTPLQQTRQTPSHSHERKQAPKQPKPVAFPKRLQMLSHRLDSMLAVGGRIASSLSRTFEGERAYCTRALQQMMKERAETKAIPDFRGTDPVASAWVVSDKLMEGELNDRASFATAVLQKVAKPLNNWIHEARRKHKAISMQQQAWKRDLHKNEDEVIGNREVCRELLDSCVRAQDDEIKKKDETEHQGSISFFSKISMGVAEVFRGSLSDLHRKVQIAISDYQMKIDNANKRMERYLRGDLIRVCHEYRQLSVTTMANVKTFLGIFHQLQLDNKRQGKGIEALGKFLESMQPAGGLPAQLKSAEEEHKKNLGRMLSHQRYTYELPVTLDMIKKHIYSTEASGVKPTPPSIFSSSLEQIMKIQRENKALSPLQRKMAVPTPMEALIKLIKKLGGLKEEGLFRLSASKDDLTTLAAALDRGFMTGKFKFYSQSPHVPAVMLKRWLRSLTEPLVPSNMFGEAMQLVRPDGGYSSGEPTKNQIEEARAFVSKMPQIHKSVLHSLIRFAHEVASNSKANLMTISNLAVVLGPCVIRNPKPSTQSLVTEARASGAFTRLLLLSHQPAPQAPSEKTSDNSAKDDKKSSGNLTESATDANVSTQDKTTTPNAEIQATDADALDESATADPTVETHAVDVPP
mmetsp:Transcript_5539/g.13492  ORF Transcript_5539/g.13492 Transcript_5539/m.13492 type:complete len:658 (-) Transcript_5539:236-2209(-)